MFRLMSQAAVFKVIWLFTPARCALMKRPAALKHRSDKVEVAGMDR
jgi:hypothetical protein